MVNYKFRKRISPLNINKKINYKDINLLKNFLTEHGKILSRRITNLTVKQQKELKISTLKLLQKKNLIISKSAYN